MMTLLQITLVLVACSRGWFPWALLLAAIPYFGVLAEIGPMRELLDPLTQFDKLSQLLVWLSYPGLIFMSLVHRPAPSRA